jgi:hypothetical protein
LEPFEEYDHIADMDIRGWGDVQYARLLLFFHCILCPTGMMAVTNEHMAVSIVFFSTFEPISLAPDSCMQKIGVPKVFPWCLNELLRRCQVANTLRLPSRERPWPCASDSMLSERQHHELHSAQIQIPNSKEGS